MIIHIVQPKETIQLIAERYHIPANILILQNGITNPNDLVVGQSIVIVYPQLIHTVQKGDDLRSIANKYGVSIMQILRNNPHLSERRLISGEMVIISYDIDKKNTIIIGGYAYPYIDKSILRKTLPFLTYLTIFNYRISKDGNITDLDDIEVIQMAKNYGVVPMMMISTLSEKGVGNREISLNIINNIDLQNRIFENVIAILNKKGYSGVNIYIQYIEPENRVLTEEYIKRFAEHLHREGYRIVVTLTPDANVERTLISYNFIDYSTIEKSVDGLLFLSYEWGYSYGPPASVTPVNILEGILNNIISQIPAEKILLGLPIVGYDWQIPYIPGISTANAINYNTAIELAISQSVDIRYDNYTEAPYYFYDFNQKEIHLVWFKDARSINEIAGLVPKFGLQGLSIWNIMYFFTQMWLVINSQYEIVKLI